MQKGTVEDITAACRVHQRLGGEGWLMKVLRGRPDMTATNAISDDEHLRRRIEQRGDDFLACGVFFGKISRNDAHVAGLDQITNRLPPAACTAIERNGHTICLRELHGMARGIFVAAVDVKQIGSIEQIGLYFGLWFSRRLENDLPRSITLSH